MTRYQYLRALDAALSKKLSNKEVEATIEYYDGYFEEALDYGKTEKEIMDELGEPENLANQILNELGANKQDNPSSKNVFTSVTDWIQRQTRKKEFVPYEELLLENYQGLKQLSISLVSGHIDIEQKDVSTPQLWIQNLSQELYVFEYNGEKQTLHFQEKYNEFFKKHLNVRFIIPKGMELDGDLNASNGNITLVFNERVTFNALNCHSINGNITIEQLKATKLATDQVNGNCRIRGLECDSVNAKTVRGNIEITFEQDDKQYQVDASTVVGKIDLFGNVSQHYLGNKQTIRNGHLINKTICNFSTITGSIFIA